ncbi:hypothetical protein UPYG_G00223260 [Umbra pygmaea]|uniref:Fibrous sheath-interacting protein 1 n=1 Tax=Umbra pygmaea TaxID=75934 RepID=A0ABD0WGS6_UMBPY
MRRQGRPQSALLLRTSLTPATMANIERTSPRSLSKCFCGKSRMDITRSSLDDISRPAFSERSRTGSRVSYVPLPDTGRFRHPSPTSLVVLSDDTPNNNQGHNSYENPESPDESLPSENDSSGEENKDPEVQKAIKKMKKLDKILASSILYEEQVKRKGKELHQTLWQELMQIKPSRSSECADETENTRRFLSEFTSSAHGSIEDMAFVPVFGTEVPYKECERHTMQVDESEEDLVNKEADLDEVSHEEGDDKSKSSKGRLLRDKHKQDFLKRNIELASCAGDPVQMTQQEKNRLKELLRDLEDEEDDAGNTDGERDLWAVRVPVGEGYSPELEERNQLNLIDSRLQILLPFEVFLSVRSPYPDHNMPQAQALEAGRHSGGDRLPGEKVLQDVRESRALERRLNEIQLELEQLGQNQEMTYHTPALEEEQLRSLLEECEVSQSWGHGLMIGETSPRDDSDTESLPYSTPCLSDSILSDLLKDPYTTSFSQLDKETTMYSL